MAWDLGAPLSGWTVSFGLDSEVAQLHGPVLHKTDGTEEEQSLPALSTQGPGCPEEAFHLFGLEIAFGVEGSRGLDFDNEAVVTILGDEVQFDSGVFCVSFDAGPTPLFEVLGDEGFASLPKGIAELLRIFGRGREWDTERG